MAVRQTGKRAESARRKAKSLFKSDRQKAQALLKADKARAKQLKTKYPGKKFLGFLSW